MPRKRILTNCLNPKCNAPLKDGQYKFCSIQCVSKFTETKVCCRPECGNLFLGKRDKMYCSNYCAGKSLRERKKEKVLNDPTEPSLLYDRCECGNVKRKRSCFCRSCSKLQRIIRIDKITLAESLFKRGSQSAHVNTREHAKQKIKVAGVKRACVICGYDNYVEVCHIKKISSFTEDTPLSIVNALSNLVILCPNHHKELDLGIISLDDINTCINVNDARMEQ